MSSFNTVASYLVCLVLLQLPWMSDSMVIHSVPFSLTSPHSMRGSLASNSVLYDAERLHDKNIPAPHSYAILKDEVFAVAKESLIVNVAGCHPIVVADLKPRGCRGITQCGSLTSIRAGPQGQLLVVDAYRGIFQVHPISGVVRQIFNSSSLVNGRPSVYLNDMALLGDGTILLTDSSPTFGLEDEFWIRWEGRADGRLLALDAKTGNATEIMAGLAYPNGVELTFDSKYVLVAETGRARILRVGLMKENLFQRSIFADNLPGMPENIRKSDTGTYWVGLTYPRFQGSLSPLDEYALHPNSRDILAKHQTKAQLQMMMSRRGLAIELNARGQIAGSLHDATGRRVSKVTEVMVKDGVIYVGTHDQTAVIRVVLPATGHRKMSAETRLQLLLSRCLISKAQQRQALKRLQQKRSFQRKSLMATPNITQETVQVSNAHKSKGRSHMIYNHPITLNGQKQYNSNSPWIHQDQIGPMHRIHRPGSHQNGHNFLTAMQKSYLESQGSVHHRINLQTEKEAIIPQKPSHQKEHTHANAKTQIQNVSTWRPTVVQNLLKENGIYYNHPTQQMVYLNQNFEPKIEDMLSTGLYYSNPLYDQQKAPSHQIYWPTSQTEHPIPEQAEKLQTIKPTHATGTSTVTQFPRKHLTKLSTPSGNDGSTLEGSPKEDKESSSIFTTSSKKPSYGIPIESSTVSYKTMTISQIVNQISENILSRGNHMSKHTTSNPLFSFVTSYTPTLSNERTTSSPQSSMTTHTNQPIQRITTNSVIKMQREDIQNNYNTNQLITTPNTSDNRPQAIQNRSPHQTHEITLPLFTFEQSVTPTPSPLPTNSGNHPQPSSSNTTNIKNVNFHSTQTNTVNTSVSKLNTSSSTLSHVSSSTNTIPTPVLESSGINNASLSSQTPSIITSQQSTTTNNHMTQNPRDQNATRSNTKPPKHLTTSVSKNNPNVILLGSPANERTQLPNSSLFTHLKTRTRPSHMGNPSTTNQKSPSPATQPNKAMILPEQRSNPATEPGRMISLQQKLLQLRTNIQRFRKPKQGPTGVSVDQPQSQIVRNLVRLIKRPQQQPPPPPMSSSSYSSSSSPRRNMTQRVIRQRYSLVPAKRIENTRLLFRHLLGKNATNAQTVSGAARSPLYQRLVSLRNAAVQKTQRSRTAAFTKTTTGNNGVPRFIEFNQGRGRVVRIPVNPRVLQRILLKQLHNRLKSNSQ